MKEILYIHAGNFSNYVGTHFWNTQESYLPDEDSDIDAQEYQTMCPRLLMFDWKDNFGPLNRTNAMGNSDQGTSETGLWTGNVQEIRQTPIPRSAYHQHMFDGGVDSLENPPKSDGILEETVRCWSDYSRVYYTPDTIQQVLAPSDQQDPNGNWGVGIDSFEHYEKEADLMEGSVRLFLEECDTLQGLQVINDCDSFGGFTASFLTSFKDDYGKATTLAFAVLSANEIAGDKFDMSNDKKIQATMTDALYLRALHELASSTIPIQPPSQWSSNHWPGVQNRNSLKMNPYYSSALASAHIESSTLPLRLGHETLPSFSAKLNWHTANSFGELLGTFPLTSVSDERLRDLTSFTWPHPSTNVKVSRYVRLEVTRGLSDSDLRIYDACYSNLTSSRSITRCGFLSILFQTSNQFTTINPAEYTSLMDVYLRRFNALAYPLPSSFPSTLWPEDVIQPRSSRDSLPTVKCISSLSGSNAISPLFKAYAAFAEECLRRKNAAALSVGLDVDELRELVHDLWSIYDNYKHDDDVDSHGSE